MHCKQLQDTCFYTFVSMVGYWMKDVDEDHFQFVHHNVSGKMMEVGMLEFVNYETTTMKNWVFSHIKMFCNT